MESDVAGQRFGELELFEQLGRGAMGEVYRARVGGSGRWVALKLSLAEAVLSEARLARFLREGEIAASLRHPHILTVHSAGITDGRPYLAFDLVDGCRTFRQVAPELSRREVVQALLPEDADASGKLDFAPGTSAAESYLIQRYRALKNDPGSSNELRRLGRDSSLGPRTRARALIEAFRYNARSAGPAPGSPSLREAARDFALAVELDPRSAWAQQRHGHALVDQGQRESGVEALELALELWIAHYGGRRSMSAYRRRWFLDPLLVGLLETNRLDAAQRAVDEADRRGEFRATPGSKLDAFKRRWQAQIDWARQSSD